ncbi:MAG: MtrB/PioB family decaheme-associated outer membrane protein [Gammaproteobacteria bacterium]|nr:MtrB/PioB family decaheme-associated outer membrane protein [Gammaproteobacteria bacterium]MCW8924308.1 MtrB/PioB family decaheme-associated outer membrane protein [Gammaproteobacteria bacterium]
MKIKKSLLMFNLLVSGFVAGTSLAQEERIQEEPEPIVPLAYISEPVFNEIELGIGYTFDDAYKFGRYSDLENKGAFLVGNIDAEEYFTDGGFWVVHGTGLGLDSRYLNFKAGLQGSYNFFLQYDELPNYKDDTVQTPFTGIGSDNLSLPSGFDITTNLNSNMNSFQLQTKRKRISTGINLVLKKRWKFAVDYSHENKHGIDSTGSAIAHGVPLMSNITSAQIAEPIDYDTDLVNAMLHYGGDEGQLDLKYHMSLFTNSNASVDWQDAFNPVSASGSISLAPDNEFHQLSLNAGHSLPFSSHLSALLSLGRMTQNQNFQPYTVNTALTLTPLPRNSLDGEVQLTTAQLKLTSHPVKKLRLSAELRYNERDNQTPVDTYDYVVLDSHNGIPAQNRPYSYKKNRINLNANYRFSAISSLRFGFSYEDMKRRYTDAEREDTQENTLLAKWKLKPHSTVDLALYAETASRDGSEYNTPVNENPSMRKYHLADRDRVKLGALVNVMATDKFFMSLRADYNKDNYINSTIGLTEATQPVVSADFSYQPTTSISAYGYYTYENIESSQSGYRTAAYPAPGWNAEFEDTFDSFGIGAKITELGKWDIGADMIYSRSNGTIRMNDLVSPVTENQYPDTKTELNSVKLWTSYNFNKQLVYKLSYWFEDYNADNWAVDGVLPYDPASVANSLLLGNETLDYSTHVIIFSASYRYH